MYRYRNNIKTNLIFDTARWGNSPEFGIEATAQSGTMVRIELDRREALKLRRSLVLYLQTTAPPRKKRVAA